MRKNIILISSYLLTLIFMIAVAVINNEYYTVFIESIGLIIAVLIFLISYIKNTNRNIKFLRTFGYGVLIGGIFTFLYAIIYKESDFYTRNLGYQLLIFGLLIQSIIYVCSIFTYRNNIRLNYFYTFFFFVSLISFYLIYNGYLGTALDQDLNITTLAIVSFVMIFVLLLIVVVAVFKLSKIMEIESSHLLVIGSILTLLSIILHIVLNCRFNSSIMIAETTRIIGLIMIFQVMLELLVVMPLNKNIQSLSDQIGNLKKAVLESNKNERLIRNLYEDTPLGYQSLDYKGNFIYVNDVYLNLLGYTEKEMIGKNFGEFMTLESKNTLEK